MSKIIASLKKYKIFIGVFFLILIIIIISLVVRLTLGGNQEVNNQFSNVPQASIEACDAKDIGTACEFEDNNGIVLGECSIKVGTLACSPLRNGEEKRENHDKASTYENISGYEACIYNTEDGPACKDCCDCLSGVATSIRTECRDTCAVYDFKNNSNFLEFEIPSLLGLDGDYSQCSGLADSGTCKVCCEEELGISCGDYQYCRTACNEKFDHLDARAGASN